MMSAIRKQQKLKVLITIDVEEEGLFRDRYPLQVKDVENVPFLSVLDALVQKHALRPSLLVSYQVIRHQPHAEYLIALNEKWNGELGLHLHPWNTPPLVDLPYAEPICSEKMPDDLLAAKLQTLIDRFIRLGQYPTAFRMGRFNLGHRLFGVLEKTPVIVDSSIAPMRCYYRELNHFSAPSDPYYPDPRCPTRPGGSSILEVPVTILPLVKSAGPMLAHMAARRPTMVPWISKMAMYGGSIPAQPNWTGLAIVKMAILLHLLRGGHALTITLHSSELMPGGSPLRKTWHQVRQFLDRLDHLLEWLRQWAHVEPVTLSALARQMQAVGDPGPPASHGLKIN